MGNLDPMTPPSAEPEKCPGCGSSDKLSSPCQNFAHASMGDHWSGETATCTPCTHAWHDAAHSPQRYAPQPSTHYLCVYCNKTARLRDEDIVVDSYQNVCHYECFMKKVAPHLATPQPSDERAAQWVSVEERLPAENGEYLVASEAGVEVADYFLGGMSWETVRTYGIDSESRTLYNVTHWMPLPEAPGAARDLTGEKTVTKEEVLSGLQAGRKLRCDRKDEPLLPWLLSHPNIENSGIMQADEQSSYIEFSWRDSDD